MIVIFTAVVLVLLVIGVLNRRFQEATLHWGRLMAGLGELEGQMQAANDAGDFGQAAELLGRSVDHRGLQDELTPPSQTNLTVGYWIASLGTFASGFFVLPWYLARSFGRSYSAWQSGTSRTGFQHPVRNITDRGLLAV